jgi:hypothetical protein
VEATKITRTARLKILLASTRTARLKILLDTNCKWRRRKSHELQVLRLDTNCK